MSDFSRSGRLALSASCPSADCGCFVLSSPSIYVKLRSNILLCLEIQLTPLYCTMVTADVCASVSFILHKSGQHFQVRFVFPTDHIQLPDHLSNVLLGWSVRVKLSVKENIIIVLRGKKGYLDQNIWCISNSITPQRPKLKLQVFTVKTCLRTLGHHLHWPPASSGLKLNVPKTFMMPFQPSALSASC